MRIRMELKRVRRPRRREPVVTLQHRQFLISSPGRLFWKLTATYFTVKI